MKKRCTYIKWKEIGVGKYRSTKRKWWIDRDYDRNVTHSGYRNWILSKRVNGVLIRIKKDFLTLKAAKAYASNPN